ncbi:rod shape-determining protein MreD [Chryseobacterium sp. A301]
MISRSIFTDILSIVVLVALQIFVLNRITLAGKYTPVLYPVFVMFYPFFRNKYLFLVSSFILGLCIDAFLGTWGINAFATTLIAYFRTIIFRTSTDTSTDFFSFQTLQWSQFLFFIFSSIFVHQFTVQTIEFFKFSRTIEILLNILASSCISFVFILIYALAFRIKQKV